MLDKSRPLLPYLRGQSFVFRAQYVATDEQALLQEPGVETGRFEFLEIVQGTRTEPSEDAALMAVNSAIPVPE